MVEISDLQEDYEEILKSGELEKPQEPKKLSLLTKIVLAIVILTLSFWSIAWFY